MNPDPEAALATSKCYRCKSAKQATKRLAVMTTGAPTCLFLNNAEVKCLEEEHEVLTDVSNGCQIKKHYFQLCCAQMQINYSYPSQG